MPSASPSNPQKSDFLIVGAGIVGLSIAAELRRRYPDARITVLEKEPDLGRHASGRNSGVLHAGIYYPEGTLKARVCRDGALELSAYCVERNLPMQQVGKVILPVRATDGPQLDLLHQRALNNGVTVELLDARQLQELEPEARSATGQALWSPNTAAFDPKAILQHLHEELAAQGVGVHFEQQVVEIDLKQGWVRTPRHTVAFGHLFNTAGLQADTIARACGLGEQYEVLPFKGLYYELDPASGLDIRHHVYPVPDLNMPFLGVHFTRSVSGKVYLGPTAIPAFGRENYRGLEGLEWAEAPGILMKLAELYLANPQGFRQYSHQESLRFFKPLFVKAAQALVPRVREKHLKASDKVGIRPQLFDRRSRSLVMDFLVVPAERSTHVLNAISPAFTCAFTFARYVLDNCFAWQRTECEESYAAQR